MAIKIISILLLALMPLFGMTGDLLAQEEVVEETVEQEDDFDEEIDEDVLEERIMVSPAVFDEIGKERDTFSFDATIKNNTDSGIRFYPLVVDIRPDQGRLDFDEDDLDSEESLASWIRVDRQRKSLGAGEEKDISVSIEIERGAVPDQYHAAIVFALGSTRPDAKENALELVQPEILINLEVREHLVERAQIKGFKNLNTVLPPAELALEIENIGNTGVRPTGVIAIYDQGGREVKTMEINPEGGEIPEEEVETFINEWDEGFGRYKAVLMTEYGRETDRELWDVIFFWVIPWQFLLIFILGGVAFIVLLWLVTKT